MLQVSRQAAVHAAKPARRVPHSLFGGDTQSSGAHWRCFQRTQGCRPSYFPCTQVSLLDFFSKVNGKRSLQSTFWQYMNVTCQRGHISLTDFFNSVSLISIRQPSFVYNVLKFLYINYIYCCPFFWQRWRHPAGRIAHCSLPGSKTECKGTSVACASCGKPVIAAKYRMQARHGWLSHMDLWQLSVLFYQLFWEKGHVKAIIAVKM